MNNSFKEQSTHINYLLIIPIILLTLGIFFRFAHLDQKVYWGDETYTSLRIAGYKWAEYSQILDGRELTIEDIQKYQHLNPEKHLADTINSLAVEDPHHPPLYYIMGRFWIEWLGDSVAIRRSLSALLSLLLFPSTYWLCLELFQSPLTGWVAIAIMAVSPLHILYAQEVREFSLWSVTIILSSAAFLHARRKQTNLSWGIYAVTLAISLYTFLFSVLVAIGHGLYMIITENFRWTKRLGSYLFSSVAGVLMFTPWLVVVITNLSQIQATNADKTGRVSIVYLVKTWAANLTRVFLDIQFGYRDPFDVQFGYDNPLTYCIPLILILSGYAIYFLCRQTSNDIWLFLLTLIGVNALTLILPDVIIGGTRSINARYLMPCYLGIQLAVAYLLANKIGAGSITIQQQKLWKLVMVVLISGSVISCVIISQAETWWPKYSDYYNAQIARIVNQVERPLLIVDNPWRLLPLSYSLKPKVRFQVVFDPKNIPQISTNFSDVFLYTTYGDRSSQFRDIFEEKQKRKLESVYQAKLAFKGREISLWKLKK